MKKEITTLTVNVPYKRAGNVIHQQPVDFSVFDCDGHIELRPHLSAEEREVANLPEALSFVVENGKPVSLRGKKDGNLHVIQDAWGMLKEQEVSVFTQGG